MSGGGVNSLFYPPTPLKYASSPDGADLHGEPSLLGVNEGSLTYAQVPLSPGGKEFYHHSSGGGNNANSAAAPVVKNPSAHPRLLSLDCFRGLVIAWMIMSDEGGGAWTNILDHSPWNGIRFADFVFPAFVFIVGMAVPLSTHKFASDRFGATKKALWRSFKMFLVGWLSASGGFPHPSSQENYQTYRLSTIRIPGILQRIAFCYLIVVLVHVWIPPRSEDHTPNSIAFGRSRFALYKKYLWTWVAALVLVGIYLLLTFATNVPGCGYGHLDPECNATGYWDRSIITLKHMYQHPTLQRTPECSSNSPADDPIPGRPYWCDRAFDPEGIVGTFTACVTGIFGLFFGLVLANETRHDVRLKHWLSLAGVSMVAGLIIHFSGAIPINKNLWSISYVLVMVGVDGCVFSFFYWLVDMQGVKKITWPFICMGMNAILVFVLAQSEISLDTAMQWFYLDQPTENLYYWYRVNFLQRYTNDSWAIFLWAITKVISWLAIAVGLHKAQIFWKL